MKTLWITDQDWRKAIVMAALLLLIVGAGLITSKTREPTERGFNRTAASYLNDTVKGYGAIGVGLLLLGLLAL